MVEVFKTNVQKAYHAKKLVTMLLEHFPGSRINFDLHDCDKILRIETDRLITNKVELLVSEQGFTCKALS